MVTVDGDFVRLTAPVHEAVAFALGWSDCGFDAPSPAMRRIVGELAIDSLEYAEEWRLAAMLRDCMTERSAADCQ